MTVPCTRSGPRASAAINPLVTLASAFLLACEAPPTPSEGSGFQDTLATRTDSLFVRQGVSLWNSLSNTLPVCWATTGAEAQKAVVRNALANTWERYANVHFTEFTPCTNNLFSWKVRARLDLDSQQPTSGGGGSAAEGLAALHFPNQGDSWGIIIGTQASQGRLEYLAVHEFGHTLGFGHEMDRNDNPERLPDGTACGSGAPEPGGTMLSAYDRDSIMHYCNLTGNGSGRLSAGDIYGAQYAYGPSQWFGGMKQRLLPLINFNADGIQDAVYLRDLSGNLGLSVNTALTTTSSPLTNNTPQAGSGAIAWLTGNANNDLRDDLFQLWNNNGQLALIVWNATTTSNVFQANPSQALLGDLSSTFKFLPVNVDNDFRTDILALSSLSNGQLSMAIHRSTGSNIYQTTWSSAMDAGAGAVEWLTGNLDLDGRTDVLQIWNNNGTIGVIGYRSNGTGYENAWMDGSGIQGGFDGVSRFFAMDVDRDSLTDVVQAYSFNGYLGFRVIKNIGGTQFATTWDSTFAPAGWAAVDWQVGDINTDGYPDLLQLWNDAGRLRVTVWQGNGTGFVNAGVNSTGITAPSVALSFRAGDMNGDGRTDIVQLRDDSRGSAFVSVHLYNPSTNSFTSLSSAASLGGL
ncbi:M57 family metalloprotease [Hyalangium versicolor]|uniref:M57 family metalloprotease n=1 Tax=Hyalangium versicolor TaxID=2861190 RepID=UPI001CCB70E2|nr:M57 family metalloprotease [Hyalangium versicolor]